MDLRLQGHTVLITGAASGIGRAAASTFAAEGCSLVLWDVSPTIQAVAGNIGAAHAVATIGQPGDLVEYDATQSALKAALAEAFAIEHVVPCAATGSTKFGFPLTQLSPHDWKRTLDVNILGMVNVAHALTPHLIQQRRGTFVFLASVAGQIGSQTDPPYSASKAANINFAQCMAKDLAPHNIRVNTVCPGMVQTPLNRSVWQAWHDQTPVADQLDYDTWAAQKIRHVVPLGRWQTPEDVAAMIVFLSSERAQQVTGQTINVDGGFVMHW